MKNLIILICSTGLSLAALSQNVVQVEYFIDNDQGFGNNKLDSVSPSSDVTFSLPIDFSGITPGYHKLYVRTKDNNGIWSLTARRNVEVLISEAKTTFAKGEYFFDNDPGFGNGSSIAISDLTDSIILQNFTAVTSALSEGYHKLYGRLLDNEGRWSLTFRRNVDIYKSSNTSVTNAEYFFDSDLGVGNCTSVALLNPASDGSFTINISRNQIPMGADSLFVRVQDDTENRWSLTQILNNISSTLPLTLLDFSVTKNNNTAMLAWQTNNEINTAYFNVERSIDGTNFTTVGKVSAGSNNSLQKDYLFTNNLSATQSGKIFYRLQMVDNDGKFTYSKIVYITITSDGLRYSIYPNPAHNYFIIRNGNYTTLNNANIIVTDLAGRKLISQKFNNNAEQKINIASLSKGLYMVSVGITGNMQTTKLVVE
ncbi:MAG: T9SS type A sorting domain-containing protein [Ginsengibacter sp.]